MYVFDDLRLLRRTFSPCVPLPPPAPSSQPTLRAAATEVSGQSALLVTQWAALSRARKPITPITLFVYALWPNANLEIGYFVYTRKNFD